MNILITGSMGFLGRHLKKQLVANGHRVYGCGLTHEAENDYVRSDISHWRQARKAFHLAQPQLVYHLAAEFGRHNGEDYYENLWRTNAVGTKNVIDLCLSYKSRLVAMSSSEVYGDDPGVMKEDSPLLCPPLNDYAASKRVNEWQVYGAERFGLEYVIVRPFNIFGPGEYYSIYRSVNCRFAYSAIKSLPFTCHRGHTRTSTFVSDATRTLAAIADNFIPGRVYNLAGSREHSIEELGRLALEIAQADPKLMIVMDSEAATTQHKHVDNSLSVRELGHKDTISLSMGMRLLTAWMKETYGE